MERKTICTFVCTVGLLIAWSGLQTAEAQSSNINFKLLYHAAQLANQASDGKSDIIGKHPGKSAWVAAPGNTNVQYILIHNDKRKIHAIAVRGTVDDTNWRLNKDTRGIIDKKVGIMMHSGFNAAANAIYRDLRPRLKRGYTTYLTGHSLGGAVAVILGIYLRVDKIKIGGIYTFANLSSPMRPAPLSSMICRC